VLEDERHLPELAPLLREVLAEVRNVVKTVESDVSVNRVVSVRSLVDDALADDRLRTVLISLFAAIAALLAAIGTYGVASTAANRRTREMAIRVAVGASNGSIARLIIGYAEKEGELFVDGARKAGLPACVPADKLKDMPNLIHVKSCDQQRAKISG